MISRRRFVLGVSALGAIGGFAGWRLVRGSDQRATVAIVYKHLGFLKLDPVGVLQFARDAAARKFISGNKLRAIALLGPLYSHLDFSGDNFLSRDIRKGDEHVVTGYLLSSDFFTNGADESRLVRYVGLFDVSRACSNPFARRPLTVARGPGTGDRGPGLMALRDPPHNQANPR